MSTKSAIYEVRKSPIHGNGVFAIAPIEKGERVVEYKGKRRTHEEVDAFIAALKMDED